MRGVSEVRIIRRYVSRGELITRVICRRMIGERSEAINNGTLGSKLKRWLDPMFNVQCPRSLVLIGMAGRADPSLIMALLYVTVYLPSPLVADG